MRTLIKILGRFINDFCHEIIYIFLGYREHKSSLHKMNNGKKSSLHKMNNGKYIYVEDAEFEEIN